MEVAAPLLDLNGEQKIECVIKSNSASATGASPTDAKYTKVCSGADGHLCLFDHTQIVLCKLVEEKVHLRGIFFFRLRDGTVTLSTIIAHSLLDFSHGDRFAAPQISKNKEVFISPECYMQDVHFLDDDYLVVGTTVGHFAVLQLVEDGSFRAAVLSHNVSPPHPVQWACCHSESKNVFVCLTESAASVTEVNFSGLQTREFVPIPDRGRVASTCLLDSGNSNLLILDTMMDSRVLNVRSLSAADASVTLLGKVTLSDLSLDEGNMVYDMPETYACDAGERHILVTLYGDCFIVSATTSTTSVGATPSNKSVLVNSILRNDLALPFSSGCWQKATCTTENSCTFYTFRADCTCFTYTVRLDPISRSILDITLDKQVHLHFYFGAFIRGPNKVLVVKSCDALLNGIENSVQATSIPGSTFVPTFVGDVERKSTILHLESVNVRGRNHFMCVCNSGECLILPYGDEETEKELLATEENPYEITSCLAVDRDAKVECILGYFDGRIKVFAEQRLCVLLRMVHCGAVDKLLSVSHIDKMYAIFIVSVCSEVGTLCFHRNEDIKVSRIVTSPTGPLTAVFLDDRGEYLYVFSNQCCNIWHLSTCRLERTVFCPKGRIPNFGAENILSTRRSSLTIVKTNFAGDAYYSIKVDVDKLIHELMVKNVASDDFKDSLFLLCQLDSIADMHSSLQGACLRKTLTSLSLGVTSKPNHLMLLAAMALVSAFVESTTDGISASAALKLWDKLIETLAEMEGLEKTICSYFFIFFVDATTITALSRAGLARLVAKSNASQMMHTLLAVETSGSGGRGSSSSSSTTNPGGKSRPEVESVMSPTTCAGQKLMTQSAVALSLIIAGAAPTSIWERPQSEISMLEDKFNRSVDVIIDEIKSKSLSKWNKALLVGLVECEKLHNQCDKWETLISLLLKSTLDEKEKDIKAQCNAALEHFAAANFNQFLDKYFKPYFLEAHAMRPNLIIFLARFVRHFGAEAYESFPSIVDVIMEALDPHTVDKFAKETCFAAVTQMVKVSVSYLPNVSFQQQLQHLAVGQKDGHVKVYNLKGSGVLTSFQAHPAPVVCVSFSSNTQSLDIATVSETADCVRIWRAPQQATSIVSFFGRTAVRFDMIASVALPKVDIPKAERTTLFRLWDIKWLSPQCIQFSSPWHQKTQLSFKC